MILAIEFTAEHIHLAEIHASANTIEIGRFVEAQVPDGSYQNGIIVNTASVAAAIKVALKENHYKAKKVLILAGGADIAHKDLSIPNGSTKQTRNMLEHELTKSGMLRQEYMFDYIVKDGKQRTGEDKSMQEVRVFLMPKALVNNYVTTIRRSGLLPYRIEIVNNSMERLARLLGLSEQEEMTILCCAEKEQVGFLLTGKNSKSVYRSALIRNEDTIEENAFIVSAVQTLASLHDPREKLIDEIVENVFKLIQFQSQVGSGKSVGQILVYGDMARDAEFLQRIEQASGVAASRCPIPDCVDIREEELFTCLNLVGACAGELRGSGETKSLDFFRLIKEKKKEKVTKKDMIPLAAGLIVVLAAALCYPFIMMKNQSVEEQIAQHEAYMSDADNVKKYNEKNALKTYAQSVEQYNETCAAYIDVIKNAERLAGKDVLSVDSGTEKGQVTIKSRSFQDGKVTVNCETPLQEGAASFAKALTDSGQFKAVHYTGFNESRGTDGLSIYSFNLECVLWEGEDAE